MLRNAARGRVLLLIACAGTALGAPATAEAARRRQHARPRIVVRVQPETVVMGGAAKVTGRVRGLPRRARVRLRIDVQRQRGARFVRSGGGRLRRRGRFTLRLRAPRAPQTLVLRVRLRAGGRRLAVSETWQVLVHRRTRVLSAGDVTAAPPPGAAGDVRVNGRPQVEAGNVVAVGVGAATPYGLLGRVLSVRPDGGGTVLATTPATLQEAIPEGAIEQHVALGELDTENGRPVPRDESVPSTGGPAYAPREYGVDAVVTCRGETSVTVRGSVAINPTIDVSASWGLFSGLKARFVGGAQASAELQASAEAAAACDVAPQVLFTRILPTIQFAVGPVPVVIVPKLTVYLRASGRVEASVDAEIHGSLSASAGLEYDDGEVKPVSQFSHDFGYTPPTPSGSARLGATLSPTLDLLLYGVGGPQAAFNVGLQVEADPFASPSWKLTAPVSLTAALAIPALKLSTGTVTVYENAFLLAQDGTTPTLQGQIRFDEYPLDTPISTEYANVGVVFDSPTMISVDGANPTAPVLSGVPRFHGEIRGHFVVPGTTTPTTVNRFQLDTGYVDNPGSVEIVATLADGRTRRAIADHLGIDQISIATRGISSFVVREIDEEPAGFAIDNLGLGS